MVNRNFDIPKILLSCTDAPRAVRLFARVMFILGHKITPRRCSLNPYFTALEIYVKCLFSAPSVGMRALRYRVAKDQLSDYIHCLVISWVKDQKPKTAREAVNNSVRVGKTARGDNRIQ